MSTQTATSVSDGALMNYFAGLTSSQIAGLTASNISTAVNQVGGTFETSFSRLKENAVNADNSITSTAYYLYRTQDLKNLAQGVDTIAKGQVATNDINDEVTKRQYEINEWANSNKLETLFFLQVLFMSLTFISALVFLNHQGVISTTLLNFVIVLTGIYSVYILVTRARYTNIRRDPRYWNKARFGHNTVVDTSKKSCPGDNLKPSPPPVKPPTSTCNSNTISMLNQYTTPTVADFNSLLGTTAATVIPTVSATAARTWTV